MNNEARDRMVARVQEAYAKYPSMADVPVNGEGGDFSVAVKGDAGDQTAYVRALYDLCARASLVGKRDGEEAVLIGKLDTPVPAPAEGGITIKAEGDGKK